MTTKNILLIQGDGIGTEVVSQAKRVIDFFSANSDKKFITDAKNVKPIDFTFGYHWWTDNSSILYFKRK